MSHAPTAALGRDPEKPGAPAPGLE
jgi:hypothetical protein